METAIDRQIIEKRLAEVEEQRAKYERQVELQMAVYEGALRALRALLAPPADPQPDPHPNPLPGMERENEEGKP